MSRNGRCEHGRMLRHAPEPTTSSAATSGEDPVACAPHSVPYGGTWWHMVAPFDPGVRAARVGGLSFHLANETLTYLVWAESLCSRGHTVSTREEKRPPTPVGTGKLRPILRMRSVFHNNERTRTALPCAAAAFSQPPGSRGCDDLRATRAHRLPTAPLWLSSS